MNSHSRRELTFAGLEAIEPRVLKVRVTDIATFLEPSTAASTTTGVARFLVGATLGTPFAA